MLTAFSQTNAHFPYFFPALIFILGAIVGSFLNVVILRLPADESLARPRSRCPRCHQPIPAYLNIPILSYLILRGKSACCHQPISPRYPLIELLTALLYLAAWLQLPPAQAACALVLITALIPAAFIDIDHLIIPDLFTIGLAAAGLLLSALVPALHGHVTDIPLLNILRSLTDSLIGLFTGSAILLWIAIIAAAILKKDAMGFADIKLIGAIGTFTGWQGALFTIFAGALLGTLYLAIALLLKNLLPKKQPPPAPPPTDTTGNSTDDQPPPSNLLPFGPMLAAASLLYLLYAAPHFQQFLSPLQSLLSQQQ